MANNQHSWGGPDGQYTPPNRTPLFTTTTVTYYTSVEIPKTLTTLTTPPPITTTDTATTTFFQTSTTPSIITITATVFRPFPVPTNSGTTPTSTGASFRNNRTHWSDWSPGHRAGFVIGLLLGVMAAALVLFCMAKRYRREKQDPESGGLWGRRRRTRNAKSEDDDSDVEGTAEAAAASGGVDHFAAGMLGGGNKKYREGKGLKKDGIGRAHGKKINIHQISDPVFLHSTRGGIEDIAGTDQRPPTGAPLLSQRSGEGSEWPLPMVQNEASGAASSASAQRRVYSRREQGSSESPSVRAVSYRPLPAEEMTEDEDEEVSRGIAKGGRKLQRRMRC